MTGSLLNRTYLTVPEQSGNSRKALDIQVCGSIHVETVVLLVKLSDRED